MIKILMRRSLLTRFCDTLNQTDDIVTNAKIIKTIGTGTIVEIFFGDEEEFSKFIAIDNLPSSLWRYTYSKYYFNYEDISFAASDFL